jgi:hypothetical protein
LDSLGVDGAANVTTDIQQNSGVHSGSTFYGAKCLHSLEIWIHNLRLIPEWKQARAPNPSKEEDIVEGV